MPFEVHGLARCCHSSPCFAIHCVCVSVHVVFVSACFAEAAVLVDERVSLVPRDCVAGSTFQACLRRTTARGWVQSPH